MKHTLWAIDTRGQNYKITNNDGRISSATLLARAYNAGLKLCVVTDGTCMIHAKHDSWTAPAYIHAVQPDARIGRTVTDTVNTISTNPNLETIAF
jgi:hypothetical protein